MMAWLRKAAWDVWCLIVFIAFIGFCMLPGIAAAGFEWADRAFAFVTLPIGVAMAVGVVAFIISYALDLFRR